MKESEFSKEDLIYEKLPGAYTTKQIDEFLETYKRRQPNVSTFKPENKFISRAITRGTSSDRAKKAGILHNIKLIRINVERLHRQGFRIYKDSKSGELHMFVKCNVTGTYYHSDDMVLDHTTSVEICLYGGLWGWEIHKVDNIQYIYKDIHKHKNLIDRLTLDALKNSSILDREFDDLIDFGVLFEGQTENLEEFL